MRVLSCFFHLPLSVICQPFCCKRSGVVCLDGLDHRSQATLHKSQYPAGVVVHKTRVFIIDEVTIVREGLVSLFSQQSDITVIGQACGDQEAIALLRQNQPDVILLDLVSPNQDILESMSLLRKISPQAKILVLTSPFDQERVSQAIDNTDASIHILKDGDWDTLPQTICAFANGHLAINSFKPAPDVQKINGTQPTPVKVTQPRLLTKREDMTLALIAEGLTNREISNLFLLKENTIAKYVSNILRKLLLTNRTQAALFAIQKGLDKGDDG